MYGSGDGFEQPATVPPQMSRTRGRIVPAAAETGRLKRRVSIFRGAVMGGSPGIPLSCIHFAYINI